MSIMTAEEQYEQGLQRVLERARIGREVGTPAGMTIAYMRLEAMHSLALHDCDKSGVDCTQCCVELGEQ